MVSDFKNTVYLKTNILLSTYSIDHFFLNIISYMDGYGIRIEKFRYNNE